MLVLLVALCMNLMHAHAVLAWARGSPHIRTTCTYSSGVFGLSIPLAYLYRSIAALSVPSSSYMLLSTAAVAVVVKQIICC
jgi:hypothetical protein